MRAPLLLLLLVATVAPWPAFAQTRGASGQLHLATRLGAGSEGTLQTALGHFVDISGTLGDLPVGGSIRALDVAVDGTLYAAIGHLNDSTHVIRWNGAEWERMGAPLSVPFGALALGPDGSVFVSEDPRFQTPSRVYEWTGDAWGPIRDVGSAAMTVASDGTLYAATRDRIEVRESAGWRSLGSPVVGDTRVLTLTADGALYAGGGYFFPPSGPMPPASGGSVGRWGGTDWSVSQANAFVFSLATAPDGTLYAGGWFGTIGGVGARGVAQWDGSAWTPLGAGINHQVYALAVASDGTLYAGGRFGTAGGAPASNIARWDGAAWTSLGAGVDGDVNAVVLLPTGDLVTGGTFTTAGGIASPSIALWDADGIVDTELPPMTTAGLALGPNPARGPATAWADVTGDAIMTVHDALGRLVATPFDGAMAGRTAVRLPDGLPPGVYVVRLAAGDAVQTARLVVVR